MSHEIRTPIAAMLGFADLLASDDLTHEKRSELLRRLQVNALAVLSLLDDLLDLAKLDAHKIVLNPEPVSVIELVEEVFASLEIDSRAKGLEMRVEALSGTLGTIRTDRYRLRQIMVNVVANAVKFTDAGGIVIALSATRDDEGERWTIDMSDTGMGIAADRHPHLFEAFEQLDARSRESTAATAWASRFPKTGRTARRLTGCCTARPVREPPSLDRGTLPAAQKAEIAPAGAPAGVRHFFEGLHVLLAGSPRSAFCAAHAPRKRAPPSNRRSTAAKRWTRRSREFDVVLMDLRMPRVDGFQATRELRRQGCAVPIVALTADPATVHRTEALAAGCNACLSKPFKLEDLVASIRPSS